MIPEHINGELYCKRECGCGGLDEGTLVCCFDGLGSYWGKPLEYKFGDKLKEEPEWCPLNFPKYDPFQAMLIKLNESFAFPSTGERIVGVKFSDAPYYDDKLLAKLYCNGGMEECYLEGDYIWIKQWDSDTKHRLRYKWPFIINLKWLD